ncbi:MAG TPA: polyphosphate kinase 1 [Nitrospirota bacterium]|nr:polyphosphate kinase 1 [Nitrospirota bacterium]
MKSKKTTHSQDHESALGRPELFINWQLSQLEFNFRVLAQATDLGNPLLERLKFLCITDTNHDEFFEIKVAGLKQKIASGSVQRGADNIAPADIIREITVRSHALVAEQFRVFNEVLVPALSREGIRLLPRMEWTSRQREWLRAHVNHVMPILSPVGLDPAHPFPRILNKGLNFIVALKGKDAFGRKGGMAVVQAPRSLPRVIKLPQNETGSGPCDFVFLSSIIHEFIDDLFPRMDVVGCYQFRVTRNSELYLDEEEIADLRGALEGELLSRRYGDAVRLEVADNCSADIISFLLDKFALTGEDLFQVDGPVNLHRLMAIYDLVDRPDLKYQTFTPKIPRKIARKTNLFDRIREKDILLHHPFESFVSVIDFVAEAARDPDVLAIKQTLYRTGPESAIVDALVAAARAGKEVTVVIELKARFDEEANIALSSRLEDAGAHITYGVVGYKTHAKMILVVRREEGDIRKYVHLGTGNYHARTSRLYTDYSFFTSDREITEDVHHLFFQLTSLGKVGKLKKLFDAPFSLHDALLNKIEREAQNAEKGQPARIIAKLNHLTEPGIIQALYRASKAGVRIQLIIRSTCSLRPGIPGISENITVRSVVGRFLEHTRVLYFHNDGKPEVFCCSADWMERNFFRRVETCFPVERTELRQRLIEDLEYYLKDNSQAWLLQSDGTHRKLEPGTEKSFSAQSALLERYSRTAGDA